MWSLLCNLLQSSVSVGHSLRERWWRKRWLASCHDKHWNVSSNYCLAKSNICCKQRINWRGMEKQWRLSQNNRNRCPIRLGETQLSSTNQSFKLRGFYRCQQLWEVVCSHLRNGFCHCWLDRGWKKRNLTIRNEWSLIRNLVRRRGNNILQTIGSRHSAPTNPEKILPQLFTAESFILQLSIAWTREPCMEREIQGVACQHLKIQELAELEYSPLLHYGNLF